MARLSRREEPKRQISLAGLVGMQVLVKVRQGFQCDPGAKGY